MLVLALVVDMFADNLYIATVILPVATARYIGDFAVKCKPFVKLAYDIKNHTGQEEFWRLFAKILTSIITSLVGSFFLFENAQFTLNGLMKFVYWVAIIGMTIFYSIRTGRSLISGAHKDYLLRLIDFLDRYEAWLGKQN